MKVPSQIYAIQAYSRSLDKVKQELDEDALVHKQHTVNVREAKQKAESLAARLNAQRHKGATDWVARYPLQPYRPNGLVRASQIRNPSVR